MRYNKLKAIGLLVSILVLITSCNGIKKESTYSETTYALGTIITIELFAGGSDEILDAMISRINDIESKMSVNIKTSDIYQVNKMAGIEPVQVSEDTYKVLEYSVSMAEISQGAFDVSLGPIIKLWGIGTDEEGIPTKEAIDKALNNVDYTKIQLLDDYFVYIEEGMSLDLGGIAKGYGADEIIQMAKEMGVTSALVNLGGNVKVLGYKTDGNRFNIGIQSPFDSRNDYLGIVSVADQTVVTSGDYERYFEVDGIRYHHIFDHETGYPTRGDLAAVSIIGDTAMDADALSTAVYVLGKDKGLELINQMDGVECVMVTYAYQVVLSEGLKGHFNLTDTQYKIID